MENLMLTMSQWWYSLVTEKDEGKPLTRKATTMTEFAHKIDSSTNLIRYVYQGTYETLLGSNISYIPYSKRDAYQDDVAQMYLDDILAPAIEYALPSELEDDFVLAYIGTHHPNFYNFETDSINFTFSFSNAVKNFMGKYAEVSREYLDKYLHKHFTSHNGFPNNYEDWYQGFVNDDARCVSVLIGLMIADDDDNDCNYWFYEACDEIAQDSYVPFEYAVKFRNGYVGYCISYYDYDEEQNKYKAYLFDANGNLEHTAVTYDPYNEYCNSAFAAWDWTLESNVTNRYEHVGYESDEMDNDEFHKLFDSKIEDWR